MQFQVPQFIEVEDKIFGPLTFKQFIYITGGAGISYILWRSLPIYVAVPFIALFGGLGVSLAFFQYNGRPFIQSLEHAFFYFTRNKLYLWSNEEAINTRKKAATITTASATPYVPHLSDSKLHDLSWSLDIQERINAGTADSEDREQVSPLKDLVAPVRTAKDALI